MLVTILPVLACFALSPQARAICQDGCNSSLFNVFQGDDALISNTTGSGNSAFGWRALFFDADGSFNTGVGAGALVLNNGGSNTAVGAGALLLNTTGVENTAIGTDALVFNTIASNNNAVGAFALLNNDSDGAGLANFNNAHGRFALQANIDGTQNNAFGDEAMFSNTSGSFNTAVGHDALFSNNGDQNIAIGDGAMLNATAAFSNTVVGSDAGNNIAMGVSDTYIGAFVDLGGADESFTVRIADNLNGIIGSQCFIGGISGVMGANFTDTVILDPLTGQLGDMVSSAQFKKDIDPMGETSEAIFSLRPVTFHYKNDPTNTPQFGLIAEEVAKVNPALVGVDKEGKPHSVQYMKVEAMLLNEFLKEHKKVEEQQASIGQLKSEMQTMIAQLKEQAAQIQKVSAQLEVSKPAPQVVVNKP